MPAQKLQATRFLKVIPSDTIDIPNPATMKKSSTTTGTTTDKLVDSAGDFVNLNIKKNDVIYNTTDDTIATVTAVDSATTLSVSADIFATGETYRIYASTKEGDYEPPVFQVGTGGNLVIVGYDTNDEELITSQDSQYHPVNIRRVNSTNTTASGIVAFW